MAAPSRGSWEKGELYELLSLMMIGFCLWFIGRQVGLFDSILAFAFDHNLQDVMILAACMSAGVFAAAVRKSFLLRKAIRAQREAETLAESVARHDSLTGLANRRFFVEIFEQRLKARRPGDQYAVLMIDLDRFKPVNDVHGHAAGNNVLLAVSDRLRRTMPPGSLVSRLGGDEFAALVALGADGDALIVLAQHIINAVREPILWNQGHVEVDATIGVAIVGPEDHDANAVMHAADLAMYEGKRAGRGMFRFFQPEMDVSLKARARLESDLRQGIARGEIVPYFQPIVRLPSQEIVGFEVLARWRHPVRGIVMPDVFIPVAEETGMISSLFYSILQQSCAAARHWPAHLQLAVNLAPQQLQDARLPERVLSVLTAHGIAPSRLEIEITESALIIDLDAARSTLTSLQNLGVKIALDDFGTGYSSLYHLRELRFDKLKIDRSYVSALEQDGERAKLVDAIIQLGASLSMQTTAEGVETETNLEWLADQGCTYGQGYLFGYPLPQEATERLLAGGEGSDQAAGSGTPTRAA
jgi:diguanylate cyclase (GGDEF)-like protein